jgi:hypothetical protein
MLAKSKQSFSLTGNALFLCLNPKAQVGLKRFGDSLTEEWRLFVT